MLILKTKITCPGIRSDIHPRHRLFRLLEKGLENRLILLSAPAGSGKTSLVASWLGTLPKEAYPAIAWFSIEESDNDPTRFWSYLVSSLAADLPAISEVLQPQISAPQQIDSSALLTTLLNLFAQVPSPVLLVLDDFHFIRSETILHSLAFAIEHLPANVHLILLTRSDPLLPLSRLRIRGEIRELHASDLAFDLTETQDFLNSQQDQPLTAEDLKLVWDRTEGWAAGLRMAFLAFQNAKNPTAAVRSFALSQRYILDFLMDEIFLSLPEPTKDFLQKCSVLDELCGPLCDAVTGQSGSAERLDALEQANLFLSAIESPAPNDALPRARSPWYRFHPLFRDLLQKQLYLALPEAEIRELHARAANWYHQYVLSVGFGKQTEEGIDAAIRYARNSGNSLLQAALVDEFAEDLYGNGLFYTLSHWCSDFSSEILQRFPDLAVFAAGSLFYSGQVDQTHRILADTEKSIDRVLPAELQKRWRARAAILRALIASKQGDVQGCIQNGQLGMKALPETDLLWRANGAFALANANAAQTNYPETERYLRQVIQISRSAEYWMMEATAAARLALAYLEEGRLVLADQICQEYFEAEARRKSGWLPGRGQIMSMEAQVLCERGQLANARKMAQDAITIAEKSGNIQSLFWGYLAILRIQVAQSDYAGAGETFSQVDRLAAKTQGRIWLEHAFSSWKARLLIHEKRLEEARLLLEQGGVTADGAITYTREPEYLALGRLWIAGGKPEAAIELLTRIRQTTEERGQQAWALSALILQSLAFAGSGKTKPALDSLRPVLNFAECEGAIQVLLDEGPPMAHLLMELQRSGEHIRLIQRLLPMFASSTPPSRASIHPQQETVASALVEPLSERELEVLACLAEGCSNAEIAKKLVISLTTVKWHTTHIYAKLGVASRVEAINRARSLGILPS